MKKYIHSTIIALFLVLISFSRAQSVGIGEPMPDIGITPIINYSKENITMSDLKGKAVILDFWATWCGPCVDAFPKMDSLQKKFGDQLQILLVNNQKEKVAVDFLDKINKVKAVNLPCILNDTQLNAAFKYQVIPHYVWIDADNKVQGITGADQVTEANVRAFVNREKVYLKTKDDSKFNTNMNKPVFLKSPQISFSEADVLYKKSSDGNYKSILTKYNPMIHAYSNVNKHTDSTEDRVILINVPVIWLYMFAYGKGEYDMLNIDNIQTEIRDSSKYIFTWEGSHESVEFEKYAAEHSYCYELIVHPSDSLRIFEVMQKDLERYFDLRGSVEKIILKSWCLVRTNTTDKLQTTGGKASESASAYGLAYKNRPLRYFFFDLGTTQTKYPIINETGFDLEKRIDLNITADLTNLNNLNKELVKFGLKFVEKPRERDVIVIREIRK